MKNTFIRLNSILLVIFMGIQANVYFLNSLAGDINSIISKKTIVEKIDDGCGSPYYIKKVVEEKQNIENTAENSPDKKKNNEIYIESIKIFKYLTVEISDKNLNSPGKQKFGYLIYSLAVKPDFDIEHPPNS